MCKKRQLTYQCKHEDHNVLLIQPFAVELTGVTYIQPTPICPVPFSDHVQLLISQEMETDKNEDDEKKKKKGKSVFLFV